MDIQFISLRIRMATAIHHNDRHVTNNNHTYKMPLVAAYAW